MSQLNIDNIANQLGTGGPDFVGMPSVGGDPVVASGSNSDGEWTRWADGTQQVGFRKDNGAITAGQFLNVVHTFPQPFTSNVITGSVSARGFPQGAANWIVFSAESDTATAINIIAISSNSTTTSKFRTTFTGRWK